MLALLLVGSVPFAVVRQRDPITDVETVVAATANTDEDALAVVCRPAKKDIQVVFVSSSRYLVRTGLLTAAQSLTYRFDDKEPVKSDWYYDEHQARIFESGQTVPFLKQLLTSKVLVVRAHNYDGDQVDETFTISGAKPAIAEVVRACGDTKVAQALAADLAAD